MSSDQKKIRIDTFFDTPWTTRLTETHLIFGPFAKYFPFGYVMMACAAIWGAVNLVAGSDPLSQRIGGLFNTFIWLGIGFVYTRGLTCRQQAIAGMLFTKGLFGFGSLILLVVAVPVMFIHVGAYAITILLLALIWITGIEFIPKVIPYHRFVTVARIVLTLPCLAFVHQNSSHYNS